jgi:hypothetical protein
MGISILPRGVVVLLWMASAIAISRRSPLAKTWYIAFSNWILLVTVAFRPRLQKKNVV